MISKDTQQAREIIWARAGHDARVRLDQAVGKTITELDALLASGATAKQIMQIERTVPIVPGVSPQVTLAELALRGLIKP